MKLKSFLIYLSTGFILSACDKGAAPVDGNNATVELKGDGVKQFITGNVSVNPKDSIFFNYTIASSIDMGYVSIQKNPVNQTAFVVRDTLSAAQKNSFTATKAFQADSVNGPVLYRIVAHTSRGVYIGHKDVVVTVKPDFDFWSYRILQVPDSVNKTNKCYYSTKDGKIYSYTDGAANSASIDFGYYWDTTGRGTTATNDDIKHSFYSLSAAQPQLEFYNITSWTKKVTLLKKMPSSVNFVSQLTSAGAIQTLIGGNMTSGTSSKVTLLSTSGGSNVIGFKTAEGKFGAISIRYVNGDSPNKETSIEIDVKVQR
ncbi:MAG: hypothetical protein GXC73_09640 [Chitinophagaceae bacterium]|nr:hypothetical protein [Chitinophagaceae bacterium]